MEFGVIDHLDRQQIPIAQTYDDRLKLLEQYDAAGFTTFFLTEHHFTPLGLAPSPLVFLAAAARVTSRIRLATLILILPLYNPLRVAAEICMVDHLSKGRLDIGIGRGISPYELAYYGVNYLEAKPIFEEARQVLFDALTKDSVTFRGAYYKFFEVPIEMRPFQQPMPPIWIPCGSVVGAQSAARQQAHTCFLAPAARAKALVDAYKQTWAETSGGKPIPKVAITRFIHVAETEQEAREQGIEEHRVWYQKFGHLWARYDPRMPADYDARKWMESGTLIFGTPDTVKARVQEEIEISGANYFVTRFAFGNMPKERSERSLQLFVREVMPRFADA
jgi:alkanesulfonate monooxygenase SsuD/methylene tetrahydromethanopterin reductase-like flavin-dependent oxidoreductase (luciferase family)